MAERVSVVRASYGAEIVAYVVDPPRPQGGCTDGRPRARMVHGPHQLAPRRRRGAPQARCPGCPVRPAWSRSLGDGGYRRAECADLGDDLFEVIHALCPDTRWCSPGTPWAECRSWRMPACTRTTSWRGSVGRCSPRRRRRSRASSGAGGAAHHGAGVTGAGDLTAHPRPSRLVQGRLIFGDDARAEDVKHAVHQIQHTKMPTIGRFFYAISNTTSWMRWATSSTCPPRHRRHGGPAHPHRPRPGPARPDPVGEDDRAQGRRAHDDLRGRPGLSPRRSSTSPTASRRSAEARCAEAGARGRRGRGGAGARGRGLPAEARRRPAVLSGPGPKNDSGPRPPHAVLLIQKQRPLLHIRKAEALCSRIRRQRPPSPRCGAAALLLLMWSRDPCLEMWSRGSLRRDGGARHRRGRRTPISAVASCDVPRLTLRVGRRAGRTPGRVGRRAGRTEGGSDGGQGGAGGSDGGQGGGRVGRRAAPKWGHARAPLAVAQGARPPAAVEPLLEERPFDSQRRVAPVPG